MLNVWPTTLVLQGTSTTSSSAASGTIVLSDEADSAHQQHQATAASLSPDRAAGAVSAQQQHQVSGAASPLAELSAESAEQQDEAIVRELGMVSESTTGRPALERLSSGAKRHANRDWSDSRSPVKRQELDQPTTSASQPAAGDTAGSDTAMTHAFAADTALAADDKEAGDRADSDSAMTHALASDIASAADDKQADNAADNDTAMTHALASDIASAADDKGGGESDTAMTHALAPDVASAADDEGRAADNDSAVSDAAQQKDISAGIHLMTDAHDSDADSADRVMLNWNDEMEGSSSSAGDSNEGKVAQSRNAGEKGLSLSHLPLFPLSPLTCHFQRQMPVSLLKQKWKLTLCLSCSYIAHVGVIISCLALLPLQLKL